MNINLVLPVMLLFTAQLTFAQNTGNEFPEAKAKRQLSKLHNVAQLNTEQFNKAHNIFLEYYTQKNSLKNNTKLAKQDRKDKTEALKAKRDKALRQILTADQWKKWETFLKEEKEREKAAAKAARDKVKNSE
ncbi:MAG: hypothetical protein NZM35_06950 [Chitinophagales bacterium]|nr:hypothetical protein [Chitinophagales bacterium]MDW8419092.1 hypothetical protein [Chitinophagales bacterium]